MLLRRPCRAADAVASGASAEKNNNISRYGTLTHNLIRRYGAENRTDLHAFGKVALVIDFAYLPRRKSDLIAVGTVSFRRAERNLFLREFSGQCFLDRHTRVGCSRHAHRLIYIRASRKRVADRAAETGRRTAERLDLGRMVVCLVLEHEEPFLIPAVDIHRDADTGRIDLLRFVEIIEFPLRTQRLHPDDGNVHQCRIALFSVLIECSAVIRISLIGLDNRERKEAVFNSDRVNRRGKCRMAAVVGPVSVDDAQLRDRRSAVLCIAEILLYEFEIRPAHCKIMLCVKAFQLRA